MTADQKNTYMLGQIELMRAEKEAMLVTNEERRRNDFALAHGEEQWDEFIKRWEKIVGHNAMISLFHDVC